MRIPFPYALTIGTDIIAYKRLLQFLSRAGKATSNNTTNPSNKIPKLVARILHPKEITELTRRFPGWQQVDTTRQPGIGETSYEPTKLTTYLAGRWAAKEAAKKAWGAHLISFRDLRVESRTDGAVAIICQSFEDDDFDRDERNERMEQVGKLSISHDGDYAVATVMATPLHPDIVAALEARKVTIQRAGAGEPMSFDKHG